MNLDDLLLQTMGYMEESIAYFNDHEIIRGYRALERAYDKLNAAISEADIIEMKAGLLDELLAAPNPPRMIPILKKAERQVREVLGE